MRTESHRVLSSVIRHWDFHPVLPVNGFRIDTATIHPFGPSLSSSVVDNRTAGLLFTEKTVPELSVSKSWGI